MSEVCVPTGDGYVVAEVCVNACDAERGVCGCLADRDQRCGPEGLERCSDDGTRFELERACVCNPETVGCMNEEVEGSIRLVGAAPSIGRVEVFHDGAWGSVCDDFFGFPDEVIVCRQLGYASVRRQLIDVDGEGPIWLDDLDCDGYLSRLVDCRHPGFGVHDCDHGEDVGIECRMAPVGQPFCVGPSESRVLIGGGILRRSHCPGICDPATGACPPGTEVPFPGGPPFDPDPDAATVPLAPIRAYAREGHCGNWNACLDAQGCANVACRYAGHGRAVSWAEAEVCDADGRSCLVFRDEGEPVEWVGRPGCDLPGAYRVVCRVE